MAVKIGTCILLIARKVGSQSCKWVRQCVTEEKKKAQISGCLMLTKAKVSFGDLYFLLLLLPFNNELLLFATLYNSSFPKVIGPSGQQQVNSSHDRSSNSYIFI